VLTIEQIRSADSDEALFDLLSAELQRLLPEELEKDRDLYHAALENLPRGLRAMAGIHFFDVSMAMDDLAWHFGNQNDERDLQETLNGLRELELMQVADCFDKMWEFMRPHMAALQSGDLGGKDFSDWLLDIGAQSFAKPLNKIIWTYSKQAGDLGLLSSWPVYARKYPERSVISKAHP
jgi:hypothetical protein